MKAKHYPAYIIGGFVGLIVLGVIGLNIHHSTYARDSYDIAECSKKYQFLNYTISREVKWGASVLVSPNRVLMSTLLYIYPTSDLQEKGLLNTLYSEATNDPEVFLNYEERNTDDAVVLLKAILSPNDGEESIYCVVSKEEVGVADLLSNQEVFSVGVQWKRTKRDLPSKENARTVISWGPLR